MMKNFLIICAATLVLLTGCASSGQETPESMSNQQARIRVFHGTSVYIHLADKCSRNKERAIYAAAGGFSFLVSNKKLGMPLTDDMPRSYHEYAIPAGKPATVEMYWAVDGGGVQQRCGPIAVTFTPAIGHNYDTFMKFHRGTCDVVVRELELSNDGKAIPTPIQVDNKAYRCD